MSHSSTPAAPSESEVRLAQIMLPCQSQEEEANWPYAPIIARSIIHHLSTTRPRGCEWQKSIRPTTHKNTIQVPDALKASGGDQAIPLPVLPEFILRHSKHGGHHGAWTKITRSVKIPRAASESTSGGAGNICLSKPAAIVTAPVAEMETLVSHARALCYDHCVVPGATSFSAVDGTHRAV